MPKAAQDPNRSTLRSLIRKQRYGIQDANYFEQEIRGHEALVKRLQLYQVLKSHEGCVNTIEWNSAGNLLVSGSDDKQIAVWNDSGTELTKFQTDHGGNIFAAKFMNNCNDSNIVSGAADGKVCIYTWRGSQSGAAEKLCEWNGQSRRVKQVILSPRYPNIFYSCSENGLIVEYDSRTLNNNIIVEEEAGIKSIAINPIKNELLATAVAGEGVKLFDLRNTSTPVLTFASALTTSKGDHPTATYIEFNRNGTKLVANYQSEGVYVFDAVLGVDHEPRFLERMEKLLKPKFHGDPSASVLLHRDYITLSKEMIEANEFLSVENFTKALQNYSKLIQRLEAAYIADPQNAMLLPELAVLYQKRADCYLKRNYRCDGMDAVRDNIRAMEMFPIYYDAHVGLTQALENIEQYAKAKKWYNTTCERFGPIKDEILKQPGRQNIKRWNCLRMEGIRDYETRYVGTVNQRTDIKQARFFGGNDEFVIAGCDTGHMFIWEAATGNIVRILKADKRVLNCVTPHPRSTLVATSGIENDIRFWIPMGEDSKNLPEEAEAWKQRDVTAQFDEVVSMNQTEGNQFYITNVEILLRLAQLRTTRPEAFENCRQS